MAFTNIGLDGPAQKEKVGPPPRFGKKPDALVVEVGKDAPPPHDGSDPIKSDADDDLSAVGQKYGADPETTNAFAADVLEAMLGKLRGKSAGPQMPPMEGAQ